MLKHRRAVALSKGEHILFSGAMCCMAAAPHERIRTEPEG